MSHIKVRLYGAPVSLYTGKVRSYLRKNAIPFEERFPSHPRYREYVRERAGTHRVPVVEFDDGTVIQESTLILDELERRFPRETPALGPRQLLFVHLMELVGERAFLKQAMYYRWNFRGANYRFITGEFGRLLAFGAPQEEIERIGIGLADQMSGYLPILGINPDTTALIEQIYIEALAILNNHFYRQPYFLGGAPSRADYALMAPLYAHLARDPYPAGLMQREAPLVFRWTERMNAPEVSSPEFPDIPATYADNDEVCGTLCTFLRLMCETMVPELMATAELLAGWVAANPDVPSGTWLSQTGADQPILGKIEPEIRGIRVPQVAAPHSLWVLQRALDYYGSLEGDAKAACDALLHETGGEKLMALRLPRRLSRRENRLAVA